MASLAWWTPMFLKIRQVQHLTEPPEEPSEERQGLDLVRADSGHVEDVHLLIPHPLHMLGQEGEIARRCDKPKQPSQPGLVPEGRWWATGGRS